MKKKTVILIIGIISVVLLVVIARGSDSQENLDPITIGASLPLSGDLADIGEQERNGLILGIEEINQKGGVDGHPLRLIAEDNRGISSAAVSTVNKLLNVDHSDIIFTSFTHIVAPIHEIVAKAEIPLVYASTVREFAEASPLAFRDYFDIVDTADRIAEYTNSLELEQVALLYENSEACVQYVNALKDRLSAPIAADVAFDRATTDFRTHLTKIKNSSSDAIVMCTFLQSHLVMPQMKDLDMMDIPAIQQAAPFLEVADTPEMRDIYDENETISSWFGYIPGSTNKLQANFVSRYEKEFGIKPDPLAVYAYDDIYVLAQALRGCVAENEIRKECFRENMLKTDYEGVGGKLTFDKDGVSSRDVLLMKVENGEWVDVEQN